MRAYKCDICGKYFDPGVLHCGIDISNDEGWNFCHACPECTSVIKDVINIMKTGVIPHVYIPDNTN